MYKAFNVCVCASGGGGNFQALIDNQNKIGYTLKKLISDRDCGSITRAIKHGIPAVIIDKKKSREEFFKTFEAEIPPDTDLIVLAGFMPIIPSEICDKWKYKIINTHPSLLPNYGGKGMYGVHVQEAVLKNNEEYAGCTVHFVTETVDAGDIILQTKIKINPNESAWELGGRVFIEENKILPEAIKMLMTSRY